MYMNNLQIFTQPTTVGKLVLTWWVQHPLSFRGGLGCSRLPILENYQQNGNWIFQSLKGESFQGLLMIYLYDIFIPWKEIGVKFSWSDDGQHVIRKAHSSLSSGELEMMDFTIGLVFLNYNRVRYLVLYWHIKERITQQTIHIGLQL